VIRPAGSRRNAIATSSDSDGAGIAQLIMRGGLVVSLGLLLLGAVVRTLAGGPAEAERFTALVGSTDPGDRLLLLGALVLALTPAVQVASLLVSWARERDYRFAIVAAGVIMLLILGAVLGSG
jgi:hypothetical protein